MLQAEEFLISTHSHNAEQISCSVWNETNNKAFREHKKGGSVSAKTLNLIGNEYILCAEESKSLLHLWGFNRQEELKNYRLVLPAPATALSVNNRNTYLAAGISSKLYLWELASGSLLTVQQQHYQPISCIKFCGNFILTAGHDGMIVGYNLSDLTSAYKRHREQHEYGKVKPLYQHVNHSLPITAIDVGKFGFKSRFVTTSLDQTLRIYEISNGQLLLTIIFDYPLTSIILDACSVNLFVGNNKGLIKQISLTKPPRSLQSNDDDMDTFIFEGHKSAIKCLELNFSNELLASSGEDSCIYIWNVSSRQIVRSFELKSVVTNLKFTYLNPNVFNENYQAKSVIKSLRNSLDEEDCLLDVVQDDSSDEEDVVVNTTNGSNSLIKAQMASLIKLHNDLLLRSQKVNK